MKTKSSRNLSPDQRSGALRVLAATLLGGVALAGIGCGKSRLPVAPVEGSVSYRGQPLPFGGVLFQPDVGPPAWGAIQSDGTFRLSTYGNGDGAVLGTHRVQIACFESQRPGAPSGDPASETAPGGSLIPRKYTRLDQSGLTANVKAANKPFLFELTE